MENSFDLDELAAVLDALVSGSAQRAIALIDASEDVSPEDRRELTDAVGGADGPMGSTRALGDALRRLGHPRVLVNECYRAAFYASTAPASMSGNALFSAFLAAKGGHAIDKWPHYFTVYDRYLSRFRGTDARVLEIGVYRGGGLDLLRGYLGPRARLVGIDIDPVAIEVTAQRHTVVLADQTDGDALRRVVDEHGPFDVVIDDGGHTMDQQLRSAEVLLPLMDQGSLYIVEDAHTSYWPAFGGGRGVEGTFIEWAKRLVDDVNAYHWSRETPASPLADTIDAVHFHDSIVVIDVGRPFAPFCEIAGTWDFLRITRPQAAVWAEQAALRELAEGRVDRAVAQRASAQAELEAMQASASWRTTEPLRRLRARLRRS